MKNYFSSTADLPDDFHEKYGEYYGLMAGGFIILISEKKGDEGMLEYTSFNFLEDDVNTVIQETISEQNLEGKLKYYKILKKNDSRRSETNSTK